jgi:hypothetical protein
MRTVAPMPTTRRVVPRQIQSVKDRRWSAGTRKARAAWSWLAYCGRENHHERMERTSQGLGAVGRPHLKDDDDRSAGEGIRRLRHQLQARRGCRRRQACSPALERDAIRLGPRRTIFRRVPRTQAARGLRAGVHPTLHGVVFAILSLDPPEPRDREARFGVSSHPPEPTLASRVLPA